jgi:hypothetical protein
MNRTFPAARSWLVLLLIALAVIAVTTTAVLTAPAPGF